MYAIAPCLTRLPSFIITNLDDPERIGPFGETVRAIHSYLLTAATYFPPEGPRQERAIKADALLLQLADSADGRHILWEDYRVLRVRADIAEFFGSSYYGNLASLEMWLSYHMHLLEDQTYERKCFGADQLWGGDDQDPMAYLIEQCITAAKALQGVLDLHREHQNQPIATAPAADDDAPGQDEV